MLSGSEASTWAMPPAWWHQMLRCAQHDMRRGGFYGMPCRKKGPLTCRPEWSEGSAATKHPRGPRRPVAGCRYFALAQHDTRRGGFYGI